MKDQSKDIDKDMEFLCEEAVDPRLVYPSACIIVHVPWDKTYQTEIGLNIDIDTKDEFLEKHSANVGYALLKLFKQIRNKLQKGDK